MTTEPLKRFAYPFPKRAGDVSGNTVEMESVHLFLKSWVEVADGFFPIGINGQYHGGIHFDAKTGGTLEQDKGVRCIADGEVVAYRIDTVYPTSEYERGAASYSRGFVLVRHRLRIPQSLMPPAPAAAAGQTASSAPATGAAAQPEPPSLVFFSLYMHLRRWRDYQDDPALARPGFWPAPADKKIVKSATLNVRASTSVQGQKLGTLTNGAEITIEGSGEWVKVLHVDSGTYTPAPNVTPPQGYVGWVKKAYLANAVGQPDTAARDDNIHVLPEPRPIAASEIVGHLGNYMRYGETEANRPLLHLEVFAGPELPDFIERCRGLAANAKEADKSLLKIDVGAKLVNPAMSETLSCAGKYVTPAKDSPKEGPWVKIAIGGTVSTEPKASLSGYDPRANRYRNGQILLAFVSSAEGAQELSKSDYDALSTAGKTGYTKRKVLAPSQEYVWVDRSLFDFGATGVCIPPDDKYCWTKYPLQVGTNELEPVKHLRIDEIKILDKGEHVLDDKGRRWWKLGVTVNTTEGASAKRTGWACEKDHPGVERCSPWSWPGFEILPDDDTPPAQWYSKRLDGNYPPDNPLLKALFDVIDTNHDNRLSLAELMSVWQDDDGYGTTLSRKIIQHENEWGLSMSEWDKLDALMTEQGQPDLSGTWEVEKKRIESLRWWDQVQGKVEGFPPSIVAHNLHPVGVIGNFASLRTGRITVELIVKVTGMRGAWFTGAGGGRIYAANFRRDHPDVYNHDKQKFIDILNAAMERWDITEPYHQAHFLAQIFHESAHFDTTLEYASGADYEPGVHRDARRMGNTTVGDGPKYRGRGLIQLTWKNNYRAYGNQTGQDFVTHPERVAQEMYYAIDSACRYWRQGSAWGDINGIIDRSRDNVTKVTKAVNGGRRGLEERKELYTKIKEELRLEAGVE